MILRAKICCVMKLFIVDFFQKAHNDRDQGQFLITKYSSQSNAFGIAV